MARDIDSLRVAHCLLKDSCLAITMPKIMESECPYGMVCEGGTFTVGIIKKGGDSVAKEKTVRRKA